MRPGYMAIASPHPWVDTSGFPVIVITFPVTSTVIELRAMTVATRRFALELKEPIGIVSDLSNIRAGDPEARSIYADFVRDVRNLPNSPVRATAVITPSTLQRSLLNLHSFLVGKTPYPVRAFPRRDEAMPWIRALLSTRRTE